MIFKMFWKESFIFNFLKSLGEEKFFLKCI